MALEKRQTRAKGNAKTRGLTIAPSVPPSTERVHASHDDVKRAASLAIRVHELADFVAGQVASWSRLGEPAPGETERAIADLEASLETLGRARAIDGGDELDAIVRDVIQLVRKGNLVRGAVMLVADATRKTNEALARQIVEARDAIIAIVDKVIFFQLPPEEVHELVQDLAVWLRMKDAPPPRARETPEKRGPGEPRAPATVAGRRRPKGRKTAKSRSR